MSDLGPLGVRRTFSHLGITLDPPPADATPSLDATAARNAYTQSGARIYGSTGPTMHLALINDDKLVYLFHADRLAIPQRGPAGAAGRTGTVLCEAVGLLDAMTGEWIKQAQLSQ